MSTDVETRALIDQAKAGLVAKPKASKSKVKQVEAADAALMNELLAKRSMVYDQIKVLKDQQAEIDAILKDAIGSNDELTVHGAVVATITRYRKQSLVTDRVKELFPLTEYPEIYKASTEARLTVR